MDIGSCVEFDYTVEESDLAKALSVDPQDDFPAVFATSRMVALMELAAARLMKPLLAVGELSVGVNVTVNHLAATLPGETVVAKAEYQGRAGKLYRFDVALYDSKGLAGEGSHTRAIVETDRLIKGAQQD